MLDKNIKTIKKITHACFTATLLSCSSNVYGMDDGYPIKTTSRPSKRITAQSPVQSVSMDLDDKNKIDSFQKQKDAHNQRIVKQYIECAQNALDSASAHFYEVVAGEILDEEEDRLLAQALDLRSSADDHGTSQFYEEEIAITSNKKEDYFFAQDLDIHTHSDDHGTSEKTDKTFHKISNGAFKGKEGENVGCRTDKEPLFEDVDLKDFIPLRQSNNIQRREDQIEKNELLKLLKPGELGVFYKDDKLYCTIYGKETPIAIDKSLSNNLTYGLYPDCFDRIVFTLQGRMPLGKEENSLHSSPIDLDNMDKASFQMKTTQHGRQRLERYTDLAQSAVDSPLSPFYHEEIGRSVDDQTNSLFAQSTDTSSRFDYHGTSEKTDKDFYEDCNKTLKITTRKNIISREDKKTLLEHLRLRGHLPLKKNNNIQRRDDQSERIETLKQLHKISYNFYKKSQGDMTQEELENTLDQLFGKSGTFLGILDQSGLVNNLWETSMYKIFLTSYRKDYREEVPGTLNALLNRQDRGKTLEAKTRIIDLHAKCAQNIYNACLNQNSLIFDTIINGDTAKMVNRNLFEGHLERLSNFCKGWGISLNI